MPQHPMPVPPIFQPELAARTIVFLAPQLLDLFLGRTVADLPRWGENSVEPQDEQVDRGAHGAFDDQAHAHDPMLWLSRHRRAVLGGATALAAAGSALRSGDGRSPLVTRKHR